MPFKKKYMEKAPTVLHLKPSSNSPVPVEFDWRQQHTSWVQPPTDITINDTTTTTFLIDAFVDSRIPLAPPPEKNKPAVVVPRGAPAPVATTLENMLPALVARRGGVAYSLVHPNDMAQEITQRGPLLCLHDNKPAVILGFGLNYWLVTRGGAEECLRVETQPSLPVYGCVSESTLKHSTVKLLLPGVVPVTLLTVAAAAAPPPAPSKPKLVLKHKKTTNSNTATKRALSGFLHNTKHHLPDVLLVTALVVFIIALVCLAATHKLFA